MAAGAEGGSNLPVSHVGREQVLDALKAAFVHGRLAKDEFDLRVGQVLAAYAGTGCCHRRHPHRADNGPAAGDHGGPPPVS